ncbi:DUF1499 domain-containing protein [Nitratireductor mangrovi]|uniref:DUF1499 domain-containing protein n=1 Tax=Nitratireductor mangrovi TaxID=2599600 RepID=A0A5B8L088_9HYPH|nr:DUF1499 domain-containing protein [Nitratireductor mangrovi]
MAAVLMLVAVAAHRYLAMETVAFLWVLGLVAVLALVALGAAFAGFAAVWSDGASGAGRLVRASLLALLTLAPFAVGAWRAYEYPPLVDVATDLTDPPGFRAAAILRDPRANRIVPIDAAAAATIAGSYPEIDGRRYQAAPDRVLEAIRSILARRGWPVVEQRGALPEQGEMTIEALASSYLLRLPADVAIRITDEGETTFVDMRSASHYGAHDLGDNGLRIRRFLADLDALIADLAEPTI